VRLSLVSHRIVNAPGDEIFECCGVVAFAAILRKQHIDYFLWAGQAAYMRCKDAVGASLHKPVRIACLLGFGV